MDLPQCGACFVGAYPAETSEAFCDGHYGAFALMAGHIRQRSPRIFELHHSLGTIRPPASERLLPLLSAAPVRTLRRNCAG